MIIFTVRLASYMLWPGVCLSVCHKQSFCMEMAVHITMQLMLHGSLGL